MSHKSLSIGLNTLNTVRRHQPYLNKKRDTEATRIEDLKYCSKKLFILGYGIHSINRRKD